MRGRLVGTNVRLSSDAMPSRGWPELQDSVEWIGIYDRHWYRKIETIKGLQKSIVRSETPQATFKVSSRETPEAVRPSKFVI